MTVTANQNHPLTCKSPATCRGLCVRQRNRAKARPLRAMLSLTIGTMLIAPTFAQTFTQAVAFGDSLSDIGNVNNNTFGISPGSGYFNGRFSNGPVWIENVLSSKSLPALTFSRNGGKNYAYGGVKTGTGNTTYTFFNFPNVGTQIASYLGSNTANASTLYSVWGGGNDLMDNLTINTQTVVNNLVSHVTALSNAGGRFAIVPNLPPLGEIPKYRNTANRAAYNTLTANFNSQLKTALTNLDASLPIKIYQLDVAQMFSEVLANPSTYGFTNVATQAFANGSAVSNPDQYLFWDDVHPTRIGHQQIASRAVDLIDTHEWIGTSGPWSTAANWDYTGVPVSSWIVSANNTSAAARDARVDGNTTIRQIRIASTTSTMKVSIPAGVTLSVTQSAQLNPGGLIRFELTGTAPTNIGKLNVTGPVSLNGQIEIAATNGYIPLPGSSYPVLNYQSRTGDAAILNATGFAGLWFDKTYTATGLSMTANATPGDADLNGSINSIDFNALISGYGSTNASWLTGDFTSDAKVNTLDFNLLAANFGPSGASLGAVVPEPVCFGLIVLMPVFHRRSRHPASMN